MSDGLSPVDAGSPIEQRPPARASARSVLVQMASIVVGFAVAATVCGVIWWWVWSPPSGTVVRRMWFPDETGLRGAFRGTGWYVVVAGIAGLVVGLVAAGWRGPSEIATLVAVVVGSALAAWLMREVGAHLGPADPVALARTTTRTTLPGDLRVAGWPALVSFPLTSLLGLCGLYLLAPSGTAKR